MKHWCRKYTGYVPQERRECVWVQFVPEPLIYRCYAAGTLGIVSLADMPLLHKSLHPTLLPMHFWGTIR